MLNQKRPSSKKKVGHMKNKSKARRRIKEPWRFKPKLVNEAIVLHSILPIYTIEFYSTIVDDIRNLISSLVQNHGISDGSDRYNIIKNYTIQLIERREPVNPGWVATSEVYKIPSKLGISFIELLVNYFKCTDEVLLPKYMQVSLTILNIVRMIEGGSIADYASVTDKAKPINEELLSQFSAYVENKLTDHEYSRDETLLSGFRFNLKRNGPNRKPKIESAHEEAVVLLKDKLGPPFRRVCEELGYDYLFSYLSEIVPMYTGTIDKQSNNSKSAILRKIVPVPDKGFKTRLVAIVDFWSQLILEPFRFHVQKVIKRLFSQTDFRTNQDKGVSLMVDFQKKCLSKQNVKGLILDAKHLKFYDISSWTDRFHRDLQKIVVAKLFGKRFSEAWSQLVIHCDWYSPELKRTVKYGQGQGMGTNGSFDTATLTDHLFINFLIDEKSTYKGLFPRNGCYGKVGDDLWIYDPEDLILKFYGEINLPINLVKSKTYSAVGSTAEFCSRTFLNGVDVSRISPGIINRSKDFCYIPLLLAFCASRGIQLYASSFKDMERVIVSNNEKTRIDVLQDWILGMLVIRENEDSIFFNSLTIEYLTLGNWLVGERVNGLLTDQNFVSRLSLAHSIVTIADNFTNIKTLMSETLDSNQNSGLEEGLNVFSPYGDDFFDSESLPSNYLMMTPYGVPVDDDGDLFDPESDGYRLAQNFYKTDRHLTPKQLIVMERFIDQNRLLVQELPDVQAAYASGGVSFMEFASTFSKIVSSSSFDKGNLNYDHKEVQSTIFKIVKVLARMNDDLTKLRLDSTEEVDYIKSILTFNGQQEIEWGTDYPDVYSE